MRLYEFTLRLVDDPRELDDWSHALYVAGADDCSAGLECGELVVTFHRDAPSLEEAIHTAHQHVQSAGLRVLRCEIGEEDMCWLSA
ncbi:MAG TPA: hypothetical protein VM165_07950 [Planctomycetaceae bacterium]|nr:hypothetical protein [Planctomycetaceae bacterium]